MDLLRGILSKLIIIFTRHACHTLKSAPGNKTLLVVKMEFALVDCGKINRMFVLNSKYNTYLYSLKYSFNFKYLAYVLKLRRISAHTNYYN